MWELIGLAVRAIRAHRLRSVLSMLGISIGIAAVILLTSLGEGARQYIVAQFTQFGTNVIAVNPGKAETFGMPMAISGTTHKLTLDDAEALKRVPGIVDLVPFTFGMARVEGAGRGRSVLVYGTTPTLPVVFPWAVRTGSFWPRGDPRSGPAVAVLGPTLKRELFGEDQALGEFVRIAGARFRVIGIMSSKGQMLGFDLDDAAFIPVARAMKIFNLDELNEIDILFSNSRIVDQVETGIRRLLTDRHGGREDFVVTTQAAMLDVFGNIMDMITIALGAIAGISLVVGAIGILTMIWIAVGERVNEIGLLRSIGATRRQVQLVFLTEAIVLSTLGGLLGLGAGLGLCALLPMALPGLQVHTPPEFMVAAVAVSFATGVLSGVLPARRAAALDPVEALRAE